MSSWSDREKSAGPSVEKIKKCIGEVNGVLNHLANDKNLQDDLQDPAVKVAMQHWTGEKRLPPGSEELLRFQDNYRIMATLGKIQRLQVACRALGIAVPLDHVIQRKTELDKELLLAKFADKPSVSPEKKPAPATPVVQSVSESNPDSSSPDSKGKDARKYGVSPSHVAVNQTDSSWGGSMSNILILCVVAILYKLYREYTVS